MAKGTAARIRLRALAFGLSAGLSASVAMAAPAQESTSASARALMSACRVDYQNLCAGTQFGGGRIAACLHDHANELSPACMTAISAGHNEAAIAAALGLQVKRNIAYGADPAQQMDIYLPAQPKAAPILIMVHGGGWRIGDKTVQGVIDNKLSFFGAKGFVVVSVNYRMQNDVTPVDQARDVAQALAYVQQYAAAWGADPDRVVLMGHSAGAHLVALLASAPDMVTAAGAKPATGSISLDSGALDVRRIMEGPHASLYDSAFGADPADWDRASPFFHMTRAARPILLICSSLRRNSCPQSDSFAAKAGPAARVRRFALSHEQLNKEVGLDNSETTAIVEFIKTLGIAN